MLILDVEGNFDMNVRSRTKSARDATRILYPILWNAIIIPKNK